MVIEFLLLGLLIVLALRICSELRAYYLIRPNVIICKDSDLQRRVLQNCRILHSAFVPTSWAVSSHVQTWLRSILPQKRVSLHREYLEMKDGGLISLDWMSNESSPPSPAVKISKSMCGPRRTILLIIPGIFNVKSTDYSDLCLLAISAGFKPVVLNRRGYSDTPLMTPRVVSYCDASDIEETLTYIDSSHPFCNIVCVAFSVETANLISYLGQEGRESRIMASVCISPTFNSENRYDRNAVTSPYNQVITEKLKGECLGHPLLGTAANFFHVRKSKSFAELLTRVHVTVNNYSSFKEYGHYNNSVAYMSHIHTPLLCINSQDDPVVPSTGVPIHVFEASEYCVLARTQYGGHCGFYQGFHPNSWANRVAVEFLSAFLNARVLESLKVNGFSRLRSMTVI